MDAHPRNSFEIALWVLAVVLIVGSIVGFFELAQAMNDPARITSDCDSAGNCTTSMLQYAFQLAYVAAPGVLTGGIACAALALAVRAADINARRRTRGAEPVDSTADAEPTAERREPQQTTVAQRLDPTLFMRPRD